ncbi:NifB/NifX family molybdenum-iron cluster-binding protein [Chloroflexota bacterium]
MKIAISATGPALDAEVDPRFGRCRYFIIVDPQTMEFEAVENSSTMASGGAGIASAQVVADKGAEVVLTGNCGPNAYQALTAAGVQVMTGVDGKVQDAIEEYKKGQFQAASQPSVGAHSGMGGSGAGALSPPTQPASPGQELEEVKSQVGELNQRLNEVQQRITGLEGK